MSIDSLSCNVNDVPTQALEALKKKEQDVINLQKKNARLIKESTEAGKAQTPSQYNTNSRHITKSPNTSHTHSPHTTHLRTY